MLNAVNISHSFGKQLLFKEVNINFTPGNCYGLIGANGAGKSTFMKILSGDIEPNKGDIITNPNERIAVLKQDHFEFDENRVLDTVLMGNKRLLEVKKELDEIYLKPDFNDEDGIKAGELGAEFDEMGGYTAEDDASQMLDRLGLDRDLQGNLMKDLEGGDKVKVLLAQALLGNPDILLLDEPTNNLDMKTIEWLQDFLLRFENTVIVISHDRHFLNTVCTHIADIDFTKVNIYKGNYDFWYHSSELVRKQTKDQNKKTSEKIKELEEFVKRFSANASKAKQATSRQKQLDKLSLEEMPSSTRKFPYIEFKADRECGNKILEVSNISKTIDGVEILKNISFRIDEKEKIAFIGRNNIAKTTLFQILNGELDPDEGEVKWGVTITTDHFPKDNTHFFDKDIDLTNWLSQYTKSDDMQYIRGFLGRMLFSGEEVFKSSTVLSGGEKVRCMLSKLMMSGANSLILDEPTNHLDLESITALNDALIKYKEVILFTSHDHQFVSTIANRIIEFAGKGMIDKKMTLEEYLESEAVNKERESLTKGISLEL